MQDVNNFSSKRFPDMQGMNNLVAGTWLSKKRVSPSLRTQ
jgi:hypothetical protein